MGNTKSQPCRSRRPLYLFYLIHRTWNVVVEQRRTSKEEPYEDTDRETDLTSRCSGCPDCGYQQESLFFDSESEMAPNAEEELLAVKPWGPHEQDKQERLRPPTYNAEDYAAALRRWGRRPVSSPPENHNGTLQSTKSSSSGYASGSGEMTLRQFTSVSELLNKLRADLRLAFPSFVQEFASPPAEGITLLLETLRGVQLAQNTPPPTGQTGPRIGTRRAALDELGCVECLAACGERCTDAPRLLVEAQPGLLALAVCLTSSLNRSRVLALQLLTRVCQAPGGHAAVSEAVSTLRLRYGEGGRFRFLAGSLLAPSAAIVLRVAGISFLNAFIKSAPRAQTKLYIQAEACEAGLEPKVLQEWLTELDTTVGESMTDLLRKEVNRWTRNCVDVETLEKRALRAEETCRMLGKKILSLQNQIENLQIENLNVYNGSRDLNTNNKLTNIGDLRCKKSAKKISSNADDEGISSSERSSTPDELKRDDNGINNAIKLSGLDNDQETTIDDVIEELRIIVKDAEEEYEDKKSPNKTVSKTSTDSTSDNTCVCDLKTESIDKNSKISKYTGGFLATSSCSESIQRCEQTPITYFGANRVIAEEYGYSDSIATRKLLSSNNSSISKCSTNGSLKIIVRGPDLEEAIVPAILHPQPPKRTPPCLTAILAARNSAFIDNEDQAYNSPGDDVEEETLGDGSDSLLSASRLKYPQNDVNPVLPLNERLFDHRQMIETKSCENLCDLKINNSTKVDKKTIRNYDSGSMLHGDASLLSENDRDLRIISYDNRRLNNNANSKKSLNQLQSAGDQSRKYGGQNYRSETDKRKLLRRTSSQECLETKLSIEKLKRNESGVEDRIRKFESLNSFENLSLHSFSRPGSVDNVNAGEFLFDDNSKGKLMRRSESFHHVSIAKKESSKRGGSDSGLFYVTNFDLEPVMTQQIKSENAKSANILTKSLDRIDEGLDSMVDIVLTEENNWLINNANRFEIDNNKQSKTDKENCKRSKNVKQKIERQHVIGTTCKNDKLLLNDQFYNNYCQNGVTSKLQLRNDQLYSEKPLIQKQWSYETELSKSKKSNATSNTTENGLQILSISNSSRQDSFCLDKTIGSKFSMGSNESGIYLPGVSYDAFGLAKSRFNAGKYSGNNLIPSRDNQRIDNNNMNGNRNNSSAILPSSNKHGKVTDVLSGLY